MGFSEHSVLLAAVVFSVAAGCAVTHEPADCCVPGGACVPRGARDPTDPCRACDPNLAPAGYSRIWAEGCGGQVPIATELSPVALGAYIELAPDTDGDGRADVVLTGDILAVVSGATRETIMRWPDMEGMRLSGDASPRADLNGDGYADVALPVETIAPSPHPGAIAIAGNTWEVIARWVSDPDDCRGIRVEATEDVTGDGVGDVPLLLLGGDGHPCGPSSLAVWSPSTGESRVLGEFGGQGIDATFRATNDYDGDGLADILYLVAEHAPIAVSSATGAIVATWPIDDEHKPVVIAGRPIDRDGDGRAEILMGFLPGDVPFDVRTYVQHVRYRWFGDEGPSGPFIMGFPAQASPDLDGDGAADAVVARDDGIYLVNGVSGDVIAHVAVAGSARSFSAGRDADGDGRPDLVVVDRPTNTLQFFYSSQ